MEIKNANKAVTDVLADLKIGGYKEEFRRDPFCIYCVELRRWIMSDQFRVDESYHFENLSNPDTDRVVYAISEGTGVKGILVEGCGVYADGMSQEMAQKLSPIQDINSRTFMGDKLTRYEYEKLRITHRRFS